MTKNFEEQLIQIAENELKVYDAGYEKGINDAQNAGGYDEGVKAERESFWDRFLLFKKAPRWSAPLGVFHGIFWGFDNFYPTKDIIAEGDANRLFYNWATEHGGKTGSLKQRLEECGVKLDTSKATDLQYAFAYCLAIKELPTIDCTGLTTVSTGLFLECYTSLESIEKIIVKETQKFNSWFTYTSLKEVRFEGVIGNDLAFPYGDRLSIESIRNIIGCLKDYSGMTNDTTGKVSGTYYWNETINFDGISGKLSERVDYRSYAVNPGLDTDKDYVLIWRQETGDYLFYTNTDGSEEGSPDYSSNGGWVYDESRTIDFGSTAQTVSTAFWNFLTANATKLYHTLTLGANLSKLTDAEIAQATQKGWTLA